MNTPPGRFLYLWRASLYPANDPVSYARTLGVTGVFVQGSDEATCRKAVETFGRDNVFLWSFPGSFLPENAAATVALLASRAERWGCAGLLADVENAPKWAGQDGALGNLILAIRAAEAKGLSVGVTSFPSWHREYLTRLARETGVWGSVQCYGRDGQDSATLRGWADRWRSIFGAARTSVSVWSAAGSRRENARANYLRIFANERSVLIFQSPVPKPDTVAFAIERAFCEGQSDPFD